MVRIKVVFAVLFFATSAVSVSCAADAGGHHKRAERTSLDENEIERISVSANAREGGKLRGRSLSQRRWLGHVAEALYGSEGGEDRPFLQSRMRHHSGQNASGSGAWNDTESGWWVDRLRHRPDWVVTEDYKGVVGAYIVASRRSLACFLVVRGGACHFNLQWETGFHGGHWYSPRGRDLSLIANTEDVCNQASRLTEEDHGQHATTSRAQWKQGSFRSMDRAEAIIAAHQANESIPENQKWDSTVMRLKRGMTSPHDAFVGHFCEVIGPLADVAHGISSGLGTPPNTPIFDNLIFQFGSDKAEKKFASKVVQIMFGSNVNFLPGKRRKGMAHACFDEVIVTLSRQFNPGDAIEWFRRSAYASVNEAYSGVRTPVRSVPHYQVTWLVRSRKRAIANKGQVLELLAAAFHLPLHFVEFNDDVPFEEVVEAMRRTAFGFGMHGGALSNEIFMPGGSHFLELLPYKFDYTIYQRTAEKCGVHHFKLPTLHFENSSYDNDCFQKEWVPLSEGECRKIRPCFSCVKDHSFTAVHLGELQAAVAPLVPRVWAWIKAQLENRQRVVPVDTSMDVTTLKLPLD